MYRVIIKLPYLSRIVGLIVRLLFVLKVVLFEIVVYLLIKNTKL